MLHEWARRGPLRDKAAATLTQTPSRARADVSAPRPTESLGRYCDRDEAAAAP